MLLLIVFLTGIFVALGAGALAGYSDFKGLTIPNVYSAVVGGSFLVVYALLWLFGRDDVFFSLGNHVMAAVIVFAVTLVMFGLKIMGAADSKLATVYALWLGTKGLFPFLVYMAFIGGALGLVALYFLKAKPWKGAPEGSWLARVQAGESKVPYGIAIVLGALASFVNLGYFSGEVFSSFLM